MKTAKDTIAVLDGVRAVACLSVIAYHINRATLLSHIWNPGVSPLASAIALVGWAGVTLFFVLSGFLLFRPYVKALLFDSPWPSMRLFYLRRALRILPGYYVALFLLIFLTQPQYLQPAHLPALGLFVTLFMDANPATYQQIDGPFWTLAIEWQYYLLLPLLALGFYWIAHRGSVRRRVWTVSLCLFGMIIWGIATRYWGRYYYEWHPGQTFLVPRSVLNSILFFVYGTTGKYMEDFAVGMLISVWYVFSKNTSSEGKIERFSFWLWATGILLLFFMTGWSASHRLAFLAPFIGAHGWLSELGFALGFGLCINAILFGPRELKRLFEWYPLRWLGFISYGLYIWHVPLLIAFIMYAVPYIQGWNPALVYSSYWLYVGVVIIPLAYLFYLCIERPWMRVADRIRKG